MHLKTLLFSTVCSALSCSIYAQDIINKKNGDSDKAKILEISTRTVSYKMWDNQDGPTMVIPIREVRTIEFENGLVQKIGRDDMLHTIRTTTRTDKTSKSYKRSDVDYGNTIIALAPIYMTNTSAVGIAASMEHLADKNDNIGLYLPIGFSFDNPSTQNNKTGSFLWAYPGIKYYPTGNNGPARFAFGPSIIVGAGSEKRGEYIYNNQTQTSEYKEFQNNIFLMGVMLNHSVNIQPTPKFYIGLELGIGIPYFVSETEHLGTSSTYNTFDNGNPLIQFQFKLGYRL